MSHHWIHLIHSAGHLVKHLVDHSKKHNQSPPPVPRCSRCTSMSEIGATNCCDIKLCPNCVSAWAAATLQNGSVCIICSKPAARNS